MKKIISISLDEDTIKRIDEARGLVTRSKFIESMLFIESILKIEEQKRPPKFPEKQI